MTKKQFSDQVLAAEKSLYYIAKTILHNDEDCADAIQNAIVSAYSNLGKLQNDVYFKTWITRILINECYGMLRKRKEQVPYEDYMLEHQQSGVVGHTGVLEEVETLPDAYRVPTVLHYIGGYSIKEIAEFMNVTESNIKMRLHRSRKMLKERMKGNF